MRVLISCLGISKCNSHITQLQYTNIWKLVAISIISTLFMFLSITCNPLANINNNRVLIKASVMCGRDVS